MPAPKPEPARVPLRPAQLIAASVAMLFRRFWVFFVVATVLMIPAVLLSGPGGFGSATGSMFLDSGAALGFGWIAALVLSLLGAVAVTSAVSAAALNIHAGRGARPMWAIARGLVTLPWVLAFSTAIFLVLGAVFGGMVAAVNLLNPLSNNLAEQVLVITLLLGWIPLSLYVLARFAVLVPVIVAERPGFRALSRAMELTRAYRWPIVGGLALVFLLSILLNLALTMLLAATMFLDASVALLSSGIGFVLFRAIGLVISAMLYSLLGIYIALLYARLREIKEGPRPEDLVTVFE